MLRERRGVRPSGPATSGDAREIASTQVEGRIGSGFFGGSIEDAIRQAASDVADYTIDNFASPAQLASDE